MKTTFGNPVRRLLSGGVTLLPIEKEILKRLVEALPENLRLPLERQMASYNLVQREIDGRALNFYRNKGFRVVRDDLPRMPIELGAIKLLSMSVSTGAQENPIHATAHAVDGYFFSLSFSQDLRPLGGASISETLGITQSWRSNVH